MFFGPVGATYNVSNQEAATKLGYSFSNDFYKQDALTEQKKTKKMCTHGSPETKIPDCIPESSVLLVREHTIDLF